MEDGVNAGEAPRHVQAVSGLSNLRRDAEWADPTLLELPGTWQIQVAGGQQDKVTHLEPLRPVARIIIPLLCLLSTLHLLLSMLCELLYTLSQCMCSIVGHLRTYNKVDGKLYRSPKHQLTRRLAGRIIDRRVHSKLHKRQKFAPTILRKLLLSKEAPHHLLKRPMGPLGLTICLGMVTTRKYYTGPKEPPELLPKAACKPGVPVMQNLLRHAKQDNNVLEKQPGTLFSGQCPLPH